MLFVSAISAHTDIQIMNGNPVYIEWQEFGDEYEYMIEIYQSKNDTETLVQKSGWNNENSIIVIIEEEGSYYWEVYIREVGTSCEDEHQCFNIESGYFDFYLPPTPQPIPEEDSETEVVLPDEEKEKEEIDIEERDKAGEDSKEVLGSSTGRYIAKEVFIKKEEPKKKIFKLKEEKKKIKEPEGSNSCQYSYNVKNKRFKLRGCNIDIPEIKSSTYYKYRDQYVVNSRGGYRDTVRINIDNVVCRDFSLFETKTWFKCEEVVTSKDEYTVDLDHEVYFYKDKVVSPTSYIFREKEFEISTLLNSLPTNLVFKTYFSTNHRGQWLDQELALKKQTNFVKRTANTLGGTGNGIYNFPFSKIAYVNQWHGCTAYQCPHKGIDFAVSKENIYASDNGVVVSKGYDTYYGECRSGGNYLVVKYDSGHHIAYLHLENTLVKSNQKVKKGDLIAVSGNSGAYNCQPLGYHLHFELRKGRRQSTHIDPVPFIDINWDLVKTNMSSKYPKRLSGDNPHPKF